jgi:hypothetical protein
MTRFTAVMGMMLLASPAIENAEDTGFLGEYERCIFLKYQRQLIVIF